MPSTVKRHEPSCRHAAVAGCLVNLLFFCLLGQPAAGQDSSSPPIVLAIVSGVDETGRATDDWVRAVRYWNEGVGRPSGEHVLTRDERKWVGLIADRLDHWTEMTGRLAVPFEPVEAPDTVVILIGNAGGQDAFTPSDTSIGFDVRVLGNLYGDADDVQNTDRIDRFFAHEFTHILHKAWQKDRGFEPETPFEYALWDCWTEGLGNYRSLSKRWVSPSGALTPHASQTLRRLEPVFVERMNALAGASAGPAADSLLEGLSSGPFDRKWGALTVALWLAQDARGDDRRLRTWVDAGPRGILILARKYLAADAARALPAVPE